MVNYLLLRDNKETGPFSLEDLLKMGLKAYDLVWISGKSAAWRYPSEIDELKPYAPEVEEQPFDRFFKKPDTAQQTAPVPSPAPQAEIPAAHQAYAPKVAVAEQQKYVAKKSVFVTLPNQLAEKKTAATPKPVPVPKPTPAPIPDYTATDLNETITITENPVAKIKYSQPLDEIKEMYVKTLRERKERIARKSFLKVNLKRAAVVGGLIGIGVLVGFILQSKPAADGSLAQKPSASTASAVLAEQAPPAGLEPATDSVSDQSATVTPESPHQPKQEPVRQPLTSSPAPAMNNDDLAAEKEVIVPSSKAKAVMPPPQLKEEPVIAQQDYIAADKDPVSGERTRAMRSSEQKENPERKTVSVTPDRSSSSERTLPGWGSQVTVSSNDYKRVALGGIRNLELTVTNRSKYNLDQVTVEVQYIKPNEQPVKTEMVQFKSISANESETVRVPDTNRGVRVEFKIVRIGSRQANEPLAKSSF